MAELPTVARDTRFSDIAAAAEHFRTEGYAVLAGVLDDEAVERARAACDDAFEQRARRGVGAGGKVPAQTSELFASEFLGYPELATVPFQPRVVALLSELMGGDYLTYPNHTVRKALAVPWHVDLAFQQATAGAKDHEMFVQCAVYLQDNEAGSGGGGLDVVPRSHRKPPRVPLPGSSRLYPSGFGVDPLGAAQRLVKGATETVRFLRQRVTLATRAGDLVLWNGRLIHRSSPAAAEPLRTKYGVHFVTSSNNPYLANRYACHLLSRRYEQVRGDTISVERFIDVSAIDLDSYPEPARRLIDEQRLAIAPVR